MDAIRLIQRLHQHRAWATKNLLDAAAQLSEEKLHAKFEIGQGTVWKSLLHMHGAEYVWLETILGNESALLPGDLPGMIPGNQQGEGGVKDFGDLREKWAALDKRWADYLAALTPAVLEETIYRSRRVGDQVQRFGCRRSDVLLHVCTHAHYTTTQVINMLRHCGVAKLPEVMLMAMARSEAG
jgi:uncharacterized damage-inducible protein DinB